MHAEHCLWDLPSTALPCLPSPHPDADHSFSYRFPDAQFSAFSFLTTETIASCPQIRKQEFQPQELNPNLLREQAGWLFQRTAQAPMSVPTFGVLSIEVTGLQDLGLQNWGPSRDCGQKGWGDGFSSMRTSAPPTPSTRVNSWEHTCSSCP